MTPTAGSAVFLDTNILVYASLRGADFHAAARARLIELENNGAILWASRQVIREFLAVTTRPGTVSPPLASAVLLNVVRQFEAAFQIGDEDAAVTTILLDLLKSRTIQGRQIHDANIVATMRSRGISWLLTPNTKDFARHTPDISILPLIP
jgi:predicted nucleic acid-binding protein